MFLTQSAISANPKLQLHYADLQANRSIWLKSQEMLVNAYRSSMTDEMLQANAHVFGGDFWAEVDRNVVANRDQEVGMEIVNDLLRVQTTLDIGRTARIYDIAGDIAKDVAVSMDGQAPYSFDHPDFTSDGDPIPIFTAGWGVNWRHQRGLYNVGIDMALEAQNAKMPQYYKKIVEYTLRGSDRISVQGYKGQGLMNHRNTVKINLGSGAGGANIDLATATPQQVIDFFTKGAFGQAAIANKVARYDVLWLSPQIMANLSQPYLVTLGGANAAVSGSVLDVVRPFIPAAEIRQSFALSGNEFLAYERRRDVVTPLVGMATSIVPLPRPMPQSNYNFQAMGAMGIQVKVDADGLSGVVYGANLA
ncbi:MAG: coat protein [Caudoviricetes sp.]|nr:MAG: coat protein [Caudoviricetes sp.]